MGKKKKSGIYNDGTNIDVVFGGQIGVFGGQYKGTDRYYFVGFTTMDKPHDIGVGLKGEMPEFPSIGKPLVCLEFDNVASIDVVIQSLQHIKEKMNSEKNI